MMKIIDKRYANFSLFLCDVATLKIFSLYSTSPIPPQLSFVLALHLRFPIFKNRRLTNVSVCVFPFNSNAAADVTLRFNVCQLVAEWLWGRGGAVVLIESLRALSSRFGVADCRRPRKQTNQTPQKTHFLLFYFLKISSFILSPEFPLKPKNVSLKFLGLFNKRF